MDQKLTQSGVTRDETLMALSALGEDANAARVDAVRARVRLPAAEGGNRGAAIQAAVDAARREIDARVDAGYVGLPEYAARFDDAERYNGPVRSMLMLFLPQTSYRPEALRVSERRSEHAIWYEVETYNPRGERWIEHESHGEVLDALDEARMWYPDSAQGFTTVTFSFNDRAQGIFADGYEDRHGLPVGDTFAYRLRAALYGEEGKHWSKERLAELVGQYSSEEMATLMGVEPRSRYGEPVIAYVTIGEREWPFFVRAVDGAPQFLMQDHYTSYSMRGDATTSDHVAALRAQYGEASVRAVGVRTPVKSLRDPEISAEEAAHARLASVPKQDEVQALDM